MREVTIHQSLNRPLTILGGDRELVLGAALVAVLIAYALMSLAGLTIAVVLWVVSVEALRRLHKADPFMRRIARRHQLYRHYYPAKSGLHRTGATTPKNWT